MNPAVPRWRAAWLIARGIAGAGTPADWIVGLLAWGGFATLVWRYFGVP
jgi:hypothetical protein